MLDARILMSLREKTGLSRKDVAAQLNIEQSTYGKYELGQRQPSVEILEMLAAFFGVTTDYLLGLSDDDSDPNATEQSIDDGFFRVTEEARQRGIDPDDLMWAMEFLQRARKRDEDAKKAEENK